MYIEALLAFVRGIIISIKIMLNGGKVGKRLRIGKNCRIRIRKGSYINIGNNVVIGDGVKLSTLNGGVLNVGSNTSIGDYSQIVCHNKINIDDGCNIAPHVYMYDHDHKYNVDGVKSKEYIVGNILIGRNSWIGVNTVILRDTVIGQNCVIGAGSVIKSRIEDSVRYIQKRIENKKRL